MRQSNALRQADAERLESRLLMSIPPHKFVTPVGGTPGVDWAVTAYTDQNPAPGAAADYRGRLYTYDGNTAVHFGLPDFAAMDRGVDVYAAAPGTVVEVRDGQYDRYSPFSNPPPANTPDNYVLIDHGDGWRTRYGRLRNGSVSVAPGQAVSAGQKIGLVGGSGNPSPSSYAQSGAFLRLEVSKDGVPVEPFLDPGGFWQSPPPFAGDAPDVHNMFTLESVPTTQEAWEGMPQRRVFHLGERAYVFTKWHGLNWDAVRQYRYFRPDGTQVTDAANPGTVDLPQVYRQGFVTLINANAQLGRWEVAAELDGVELGRTSFLVEDPSSGLPEIKVYQGDTYVVDGRTTPIDFGITDPGAGPTRRTFTLFNHGTVPLTLGQVTLPAGFSLTGTTPSSVPANSSRTLTIQLDDVVGGAKAGRVTIRSNDAEQGEFDFAVRGVVTAPPPPVVMAVYLAGSAWQPAFGQFLAAQGIGSAALGWAAEDGAAQPDELPWANLDQIGVTFDSPVQVDFADLRVRGASTPVYDLDSAAFNYDPATRTATWRLMPGQVFGADRLTLELDGDGPDGVRSPAGAYLDGDWTNPSATAAGGDAFPSGDATSGGDFRFAVNILPGDVNRSGMVLADDFSAVKKKFFSSPSSPGTGDAAYSVFHDVDGSGTILANDFSEVKRRFFNELPAPAPSTIQAARPAAFSDTPVASRTARPQRRGLLDEPEAGLLA